MDFLLWLSQLDPNAVVPGLGIAGLIGFTIFSIIKGWLIPVNIFNARIGDKDTYIKNLVAERDTWRDAHAKSEEAREILLKQNSDLIDSAKTTNHLIESLRNLIERGS